MGDLSKKFLIDTFDDIVTIQYGVKSSSEDSVFETREIYGDELTDDFMNVIYEHIAPSGSEWPYDEIWQDEEFYNKQRELFDKIQSSISEKDLEENGLDINYLPLVKKFIDYAIDRLEGGG